jgi:hypothetical protein
MGFVSPYPAGTRRDVEALLRQPGPSMADIALRTGVAYQTVRRWNQEGRIRAWTRDALREANFSTWTHGRLQATARVLGHRGVDPGDVAEATGCRRRDAAALMLACGSAAARDATPLSLPGAPPDLGVLNTALRVHIGRQIAAFDEQLRGAAPVDDPARLLRDMGGLKRLLDDLARAQQQDADGDADGEPLPDLAALRADLARRYEAFASGGHVAGLPGEPAA